MRGVNDLGSTDGGKVAVALIGEDQSVGLYALDAGCDCGGAAMRGLVHVAVEILICEDGATDRRDADDVAVKLQLIDSFRHQAMDNAVVAAGAVMERLVSQQTGFFKYYGHLFTLLHCEDLSDDLCGGRHLAAAVTEEIGGLCAVECKLDIL